MSRTVGAEDSRGYCESCDGFGVQQSKDLASLENTCKVSKGKLKVKCTKWHKEIPETPPKDAALAFIPKKKKVRSTIPDFQDTLK